MDDGSASLSVGAMWGAQETSPLAAVGELVGPKRQFGRFGSFLSDANVSIDVYRGSICLRAVGRGTTGIADTYAQFPGSREIA